MPCRSSTVMANSGVTQDVAASATPGKSANARNAPSTERYREIRGIILSSALLAQAKEGDGVIVDAEPFPPADSIQLGLRHAQVQLDDPMTASACQVMVVPCALAQPKGMGAVGELDPVQDLHANELVDGPVHGGSADAGMVPPEPLQQVLRRECRSAPPQADQAPGNGLSWLGASLADGAERLLDSRFDVHRPVSALSEMIAALLTRG